MLKHYVMLLTVLLVLSACGSKPVEQAGAGPVGTGDPSPAIELVGTWALVMDDPELALEVLPDGTPLGFRTTFHADHTGKIDLGGDEASVFSWSYGPDGVLKQIFTLATGGTNTASYRVEDLGGNRIRLVNVDHPTQDVSTYLRR